MSFATGLLLYKSATVMSICSGNTMFCLKMAGPGLPTRVLGMSLESGN